MLLQTGQNSTQGAADERMMQLLRLLNRLLERSPESRRRLLAWHTPIIVPVWPQVGFNSVFAALCLRVETVVGAVGSREQAAAAGLARNHHCAWVLREKEDWPDGWFTCVWCDTA